MSRGDKRRLLILLRHHETVRWPETAFHSQKFRATRIDIFSPSCFLCFTLWRLSVRRRDRKRGKKLPLLCSGFANYSYNQLKVFLRVTCYVSHLHREKINISALIIVSIRAADSLVQDQAAAIFRWATQVQCRMLRLWWCVRCSYARACRQIVWVFFPWFKEA